MFSSPAIPLQSQENLNGIMARKQVAGKTFTRKAFQDRDVNAKQDNPVKKQPVKTHKPKETSESKYPDWLLDVCSYKDVEDTYADILSESDRIDWSSTDVIKNFALPLHSTPPPSPTLSEGFNFQELHVGRFDSPVAKEKLTFDFEELPPMPIL